MKKLNIRLIVGLIIVIIAILFFIYEAINNIIDYTKNDGSNYRKTYGVITDVRSKSIVVQYKVDGVEYNGEIDFLLEPIFKTNSFYEMYYNVKDPTKITSTNYTNNIIRFVPDVVIIVLAISVVSYILYKYYQLIKHSEKKPLILVGYEKRKLVFKEKENTDQKINLYYSKALFNHTQYDELVTNNDIEAELIYLPKHPKIWSVDLTKIEEVLKNEN